MLTVEFNVFFCFLTSLILTYIFIPKVINFAKKFRLSDVPGERASHTRSIPVFGGVAIFAGILISLLFWIEFAQIKFILGSLLVVFILGILDDLLGLSPRKKLVGQILAVLILIYCQEIKIDNMHGVLGINELPEIAATLFTIFVVVVITNAFNLIDGVDGLAGCMGIVASSSFGVLALLMGQYDIASLSFSLVGALLAFLRYNFSPAKIFMGDTGSMVVGLLLSVLAINLVHSGFVTEEIKLPHKGPLLAIVFLGIPLFDSLRVFVVRSFKGIGPLSAGRDHIHHALLDLGCNHKVTSIALCFLSLVLIGVSYFLIEINISLGIALLAFFSYAIMILPFYLLRKKNL